MTGAQARDEILALLRAAWLADATTAPLLLTYADDGVSPPTSSTDAPAWARADVREVTDRQASLTGADGTHRYEVRGLVILQVFTATGDGNTLADHIAGVFKSAFCGTRTSGGAWFRNVRVIPVGTSGPWKQHNGIAEYSYDEVR